MADLGLMKQIHFLPWNLWTLVKPPLPCPFPPFHLLSCSLLSFFLNCLPYDCFSGIFFSITLFEFDCTVAEESHSQKSH